MMSLAFQWDRDSAGANRTGGKGEANNDSIWRYFGADHDGRDVASGVYVYRLEYIEGELRGNSRTSPNVVRVRRMVVVR